MRKITFILTLVILFSFNFGQVLAKDLDDSYMTNSFYAIQSSGEYSEINNYIVGDSNHMYFLWGRLAPNVNGKIQFTNKYKGNISEFDIRNTEFGLPHNKPGGYMNKIHYNENYDEGKAFLSVFFEGYTYGNKKHSVLEFLNMEPQEWDEYIIDPMINMMNGIYDDKYNTEWEFDGIVLDFEGFINEYESEEYTEKERTQIKTKYTRFLAKVKGAIDEKELIVCVHPTNVVGHYDGYDYRVINAVSDYIILMAYDYQDANRLTGDDLKIAQVMLDIDNTRIYKDVNRFETQPYNEVKMAVDEMINKYNISSKKLILGMNLTGMKWIKLSNAIDKERFSYYLMKRPYLDGIEELVDSEEVYIEESKTYKKELTGDKILLKDKEDFIKERVMIDKVEYYYENPDSLNKKYYEILEEYKLAGLSVWRLGTGSEKMWKNLYNINDYKDSKVIIEKNN